MYLILYDTIPGGTGYLSKFFEPENFTEVIGLAYEAIKGCSCQHHGKDGCYHCVLSHRQRYEHESLSREKAEQLFAKLFQSTRTWEKHTGKIGGITTTGQIEESELEDRFVALMKRYAESIERKSAGWAWEESNVNGVVSYVIRVVQGTTSLDYALQPQVTLGRSEGVKYSTRPDFVFRCIGGRKDGHPLLEQEVYAILPIAIYLDGYRYHASAENFRLLDDIKKRIGVHKSGQYLVWTLTWDDLGLFEKIILEEPLGDLRKTATDSLYASFQLHPKTKETLVAHPIWKRVQPTFHLEMNNVTRLLHVLGAGLDAARLRDEIKSSLALCQRQFGEQCYARDSVQAHLKRHLELDSMPKIQSPDAYMRLSPVADNSCFEYRVFAGVKAFDFMSHVRCLCSKTRIPPKEDWQEFWRLSNLLLLITGNAESKTVPGFSAPNSVLEEEDDWMEEEASEVETILQYFDPPFHSVVRLLVAHAVNFWREGDFELMSADGQIVACAAVGIPECKVAVGAATSEDRTAFEEAGYSVFEPENFRFEDLQTKMQ